MKKISILGSTGSVGTQSLDVVRNLKKFEVVALSAWKNINLLESQIRKFNPKFVCISDKSDAEFLSEKFKNTTYSIVFIMVLSILLSLLGRNTLNWFVDLTSFGAIVGFGYTSAAAYKIAKTEGIIAAIESSHAIAYARKLAPTMDKDQIIIVTVSGRGDKDCAAIARYRGEDIYE